MAQSAEMKAKVHKQRRGDGGEAGARATGHHVYVLSLFSGCTIADGFFFDRRVPTCAVTNLVGASRRCHAYRLITEENLREYEYRRASILLLCYSSLQEERSTTLF